MRVFSAMFQGSRKAVLLRAALLIAAIAVLDWQIVGEIPLGFLYLLPMLMVGSVLRPWQIAGVAALCTFLAEVFDDLVWSLRAGISRDVLYFAAFFGVAMFVQAMTRSRRAELQHLKEIDRQSQARLDAEEQLRVLVESSPAAIVTADTTGTVLMANDAAHRMFGVAAGELPGREVHRYLPSLRNVAGPEGSQEFLRAVMQAKGQREDGETFLADISFSTYRTDAGLRLAAMVLDASEDLRTHEVEGLHQLMEGSRIAVSAVSHEIRNVCGAIAVVHQNLLHSEALSENRDFEALGHLIGALERIASVNLRQSATQAAEVDLGAVLEELRIVVAPMLEEENIEALWTVETGLPPVWADRASLMQVFLNLVTNSMRAVAKRTERWLMVGTKSEAGRVVVEVSDNGGGVAHPEHLFRPFQEGAESSGLGLYLSRAFLRSFGAEIRYRPTAEGACFAVYLNAAAPDEDTR